jgi:alpha-glucosidase
MWLLSAGEATRVAICRVTASQTVSRKGSATDRIQPINPPEQDFYAKRLDYEGIPIKAAAVVADEALFAARDRLQRILKNLPTVRYNLKVAGAELHIIGKDQVTSDLPEFRNLKGKPFDGKLTVDQRTRGLGGLLTSCGEENLLQLPGDRYAGRDICIHEFAHNIQDHGLSEEVRLKIREQFHRSLDKGLWKGAYAATNESEFFAELTMWYFGTHGDLHMTGTKPANGPEGLQAYDPEAYALLDDIYSGRIPIHRIKPSKRLRHG